MTFARCCSTLLLYLCMSAVQTGLASAATYEVVSCKEADRETLPTADWSFESSGADFEFFADCRDRPIALITGYSPRTPPGGGASITFTARAPLRIVAIRNSMLLQAPRSDDPTHPW